jgi:hypothetical protein
MLYCCFTAALLLLYCCFTTALLDLQACRGERRGVWRGPILLLYYCFTAALLDLQACLGERRGVWRGPTRRRRPPRSATLAEHLQALKKKNVQVWQRE